MHSVASRLAKKVYEKYGIFTGEANGGPLLWRITKEMGGTRKLGLNEEEGWLIRGLKQRRCTALGNELQASYQYR